MIFALLVVVFLVSWGLTGLLRRYALSKSLMDIPNERSAHSVPTPRGGGVAIVVAFLLALPVLTSLNLLSLQITMALSGAGLLTALIGFVDDHGHIAARWRLLGHFIAAGWILFWLNGLAPIELLGVSLAPAWIGAILGSIYLVWMLNLYNFMDGIDGLASTEAISVCLGMCLVYWYGGVADLIWAPMALAVAVAGFLCWNFPPARIFMGDAGSGFLGIMLGAMAIQAAWSKPELIWSWLILLGVFIVDATWTLVRRLFRGDKVYHAHSTHAYQKAARRWGHKKVTLCVAAINVAFLLPLSILVVLGHLSPFTGVGLAYVPLAGVACRLGAGRP